MKVPEVTVLDFETERIDRRPAYPPKPVGFSIKRPGEKRSTYYAWGHTMANNCSISKAREVLATAWRSDTLCCHHGKFDVDVAQTHMGMPAIGGERVHDTLYLLFLHDPHAQSLSLKPSAERILGMKPGERDVLRDWILKNVPEARRKPSEWGAYIAKAPGDLVGRYADGDVVRTERLFEKLYRDVARRSMLPAYDRERRLMPILLENEREGVRVDLRRLERDYRTYTAAMEKVETWLRKRLGAPDLNLDADREVADALERTGIVTEWVYTKPSRAHPEGQKSVAKENLTPEFFRDRRVASAFGYRNRLQTCLSMFMIPWLEMARESGGIVYTNWNQVRQSHGNDKFVGARTGRLSSSPNFQNVIKHWKKAFAEGYVHPKFLNLPELPLLRVYFLPDSKDELWGRRDYNQQELRILAHFEDDKMLALYHDDPRLDIHALVQGYVHEIVGLLLPREPIKILNFADIYGQGLGTLAERMNVDVALASKLRRAKNHLLPGVELLDKAIKARAGEALPIRTWGGREYYCEAPMFIKKYNRVMTFAYKLLNYLIQGSASDCTKESIIRYHGHPKRRGRFLISVHDENNISAPKKVFREEMELLREVMQSVEFDLPMLSDGESGLNWGTMKKFTDL